MSGMDEASLVTPQRPGAQALRVAAGSVGPLPLQAGTRLQEFEIYAVIGQGGFGIVYLARDLSLQRMVAIKEYMPAQLAGRNVDCTVRPLTAGQADVFELGRRSFINEARMLARFKHPGLLEVLRFWEQNGTAYMAMPYYDGATLTQYLKRHPGVATEDWLKKTLKPLVDALGHMHEEDCFHRDVAPDNILVLKDGSAVLLDLGAARRVIADDAQAMTVMLKPGYAPIEQYSDDPRFRQGPWTDVYAMAAVFFFGVTGKAPPASASRVMRDSVSPLSNVRPAGFSESFLRAIDQGLSLQPEDRPRSIDEFRALLYAMPATPAAAAKPLATRSVAPTPAAETTRGQGAAADTDDPFVPPASGGTSLYVAAGLAALAVALATGWYAMKPALTEADAASALALPAAPVSAQSGFVRAADPAGETLVADAAASPAADTAAGAVVAPVTPAAPVAAAAIAAPGAAPSKVTAPPSAATAPARASSARSSASTPGAATGTVVLAVKPWAEVRVDGVVKGVSPPLKQLTLPAGQYTIEFRNPASAPVKKQIDVRANSSTTIQQQF